MELVKLTNSQKIEAGVHYKPTKLTRIVDEFAEMNEDIMEIKLSEGEYSSPHVCVTSIKNYLKRTHRNWMSAKVSRGRVYIYKTEPIPEDDEVKTCVECGKQFVITVANKKWLSERGLVPFTRCEDCRNKRKQTII